MLAELWSDFRYRVRTIFRRAVVERELADELRAHLEHETDKHVRTGVPVDEARRRAGLAFGGIERIKDDSRDVRGLAWLDIAAQECRYAVRALRARPGFTLAVVATLALGIGANAAMFGIVDHMLFRPAPYLRDPSSVNRVYLAWTDRGTDGIRESLEFRRYRDIVRWTSSFSQSAAFQVAPMGVGSGDASREMAVGVASASFFDFFDVHPLIGRFFAAADDALPAGEPVAVIGYDFWQIEYGGRRDAIGRKIQIGSGNFTVIGVAPKGFSGANTGATPVAWIPIASYAAARTSDFAMNYNWGWLSMLVRRRPGVAVAAATADVSAAYQRSWLSERAIDPSLPPIEAAKPHGVLAPTQPDRGPTSGSSSRGSTLSDSAIVVLLVGGMAIVVLLVACANVANLLLARGFGRRREIAVRLAMGVGRGRLLGHLVAESMLLALLGAIAGLVVAHLVGGSLAALFGGAAHAAPLFDGRTLMYSGAITITIGLVTGALPALYAGRTDLLTDLRAGARDSGYRRSRIRSALVVVQATLCVVLLVGAGVFVRSLINVRSLPLGFDADRVVFVHRSMRGVTLTADQSRSLVHRLIDAANALPGVEGATAAASVPFYDYESLHLSVPGVDSVSRLGQFLMQLASPGYFVTMGTRIIAGRGITTEDRVGTPRVVVVSATMARKLWPGRTALGQTIHIGADSAPLSTVVGIAQDIKERGLTHEPEANYYLPVEQFANVPSGMYVRVHGSGTASAEMIRRGLQPLMSGGAYVTATPLAEIVEGKEGSWRLGATMFVAFGTLALALGAIGLYSVIAFGVEHRSRELSIRIALGAQIRGVLALVMGEGMRLALVGLMLGVFLALLGGRWISALLFDESARDPVVFCSVALVLLAVSIVATVVPALRATRLDPNVALRAD